jgi:hypothetical protein
MNDMPQAIRPDPGIYKPLQKGAALSRDSEGGSASESQGGLFHGIFGEFPPVPLETGALPPVEASRRVYHAHAHSASSKIVSRRQSRFRDYSLRWVSSGTRASLLSNKLGSSGK